MRIHPTFSFFLSPLSPGLAWRIGQPGVSYVPEMNLFFSLSISWRPFLLLLLHREICWQSSSPPTQSRFPISMRPSGQSIRKSPSPSPREKMHRIYGRVWGTVRKCDATADAYFSPGPKTFFMAQVGRASKSLFQGRFFFPFSTSVPSFFLFHCGYYCYSFLGCARNPSEARNWGITGPSADPRGIHASIPTVSSSRRRDYVRIRGLFTG